MGGVRVIKMHTGRVRAATGVLTKSAALNQEVCGLNQGNFDFILSIYDLNWLKEFGSALSIISMKQRSRAPLVNG